MKFNQTLDKCVQANLKVNTIPMLLGEPGIGKSSWLEDLARRMNTKCFTLACNQLGDRVDLTGARMVPTKNAKGEDDYTQVFFPHVVISKAIRYAEENPNETPILFLDELNRTTPDITSALLSIPTLRSIGNRKLPDNLRVVIAGNDRGNITALDEASISRFIKYHVEPDTQTYIQLHEDLNPFIKNVLEAHPEFIFCKNNQAYTSQKDSDHSDDEYVQDIEDLFDDESMDQITTPRTITALSNWLNLFDNKELLDMLMETTELKGDQMPVLQEAIEGHVGTTQFSAALLEELANNLTTQTNQTSDITPGKPAIYDKMKKAGTHREVIEIVETMSHNDLSGSLLYALYEDDDNEIYIKTMNMRIADMAENGEDFQLSADHMKSLMKFASSDKLDDQNVETFLEGNTQLSQNLAVILQF